MLVNVAGGIVRGLERIGLRGGPTMMRGLSRLPGANSITAKVRLPSGQWISFPAFDPYWSRYLWAGAPYEADVEAILRMIGKGRLFVDCGANIGYWSARAHQFGFARVIAVEPNPALIPFLRQNIADNSVSGSVVNAAIHDTSGESLFLQRTETHACASVGAAGVPIQSVNLTDLLRDVPATEEIVVKLDVEGAEIRAIQGAGARSNIIYVYEDWAQHRMPVTDFLISEEFLILGVRGDGTSLRIESVDDALGFNHDMVRAKGPSNLIACAPEKFGRLRSGQP